MDKARFYILENFVHVAVDSKDLLELTIDDFHSFISDDMLNLKVILTTLSVIRLLDLF